jgi:putative SOS response-associated peptidase YedK
MCGRITLTNPAQVPMRFAVPAGEEGVGAPRYNIAPGQSVLAVVERPEGRILRWMRWGFRPAWAHDRPEYPAPFNARAETLAERPLFRGALTRGRCLVVADGFFEWQMLPRQKRKRPIYLRLRSGGLFGIAGLYAEGPGLSGDPLPTCALVTCRPNDLIAPIHDRMPVLLDPAQEAVWLDPGLTDEAVLLPLLQPYLAEALDAVPVRVLVNDASHEGPELIAPLRGAA